MNLRIKINLVFAALFFLLLSFGSAQAQVQTPHYNTYVSDYSNGFYDYLPQGYSASGTTLYPVIIFVHGSWEAGSGSTTDLPKVLKHGPPHVINVGEWPNTTTLNGKTYKFIVFSPQFKSSSAGAAAMNTVIDYVMKHYKADPSRIYITGLSSGGGTVEAAAADATVGKRIAAMLEFAGTSSPSVTRAQQIVANKVAWWGIHNLYDDVVPYTKTTTWYSDIMSVSSTYPVKKLIPNGTGHNCWSTRYVPTWTDNGLNVYQWMLQYSRSGTTTTNTPPVANAGSDKTIWIPTTSVTLSGSGSDANGSISKYSWSKVSGPSSYSFSSTSSASTTVSNLVAGTYVFRLTVTDNGGATDYDDVNVVVKAPIAIPGQVQAENYSSMYGVKTETTTDVNGGLDVGSINQGDWMNYSVNASTSGTYYLTFRVATPNTGAQFQVKNSSGTVLTTVNVPNTGGYQTWQNVTAKVTLPSGTQTLKIYSSATPYWNINYTNFSTSSTTSSTTTSTAKKIEAENYSAMYGVQKETTTDVGGGQDVGGIDLYDWMSYYNISLGTSGTYTFTFRLASAATGGQFQVYDSYNSTKTLVGTVSVPNTGGWQTWKSVTASIKLLAGTHTLTLYSTASAHWNINYFTYGLSTSTTSLATTTTNATATEQSTATAPAIAVAPNPFSDRFVLQVNNQYTGTMNVQMIDMSGVVRKQFQVAKNTTGTLQTYLSAGTLTKGTYVVRVQLGTWIQSTQIIKL